MGILVFVVVLVVLILVHEFGHFIVAKLSGMRVDEFGIGFPPRIWGKKVGETVYSVNALPFGGFVRIYGEDATDEKVLASSNAFSSRPRFYQALTLIAGIAMNLLLAYVLITITLMMGTPRALSDEEIPYATNLRLAIADVMPGSPADVAGIKAGDMIISVEGPKGVFTSARSEDFISYVAADTALTPLTFTVERNNSLYTVQATPATGVISDDPTRPALGVSLAPVGVLPESLSQAPIDGALFTWEITKEVASGLAHFFGSVFTLRANLAEVSGPVGIASSVGNAFNQGWSALLSFMAVISINLALINLLPIPAVDGGRLLFVIIESIIRKPIKPSVAAAVNGIGFAFLLLLFVAVTGSDIWKLVH